MESFREQAQSKGRGCPTRLLETLSAVQGAREAPDVGWTSLGSAWTHL